MADPTIPKLRLPLSFTDGRARLVEQDSQAEVEQCVEVILRTVAGERLERPDFGIPDFVHRQGGVDVDAVKAAIDRDEPRAVYAAAVDNSNLADLVSRIGVQMEDVQNG